MVSSARKAPSSMVVRLGSSTTVEASTRLPTRRRAGATTHGVAKLA